jgi:phosphate transport system protein
MARTSRLDGDPPAGEIRWYSNTLRRRLEPGPSCARLAAVERGYPLIVRDAYQEQLDRLANGLADMCNLVAEALDNATRALLRADLRLAEQVITDDARIDDLRTAAEQQAFTLLVLQAPVATDLRIVVSGLHAASDLERMGDLALHIARAARRRHPDLVMPAEVAPYLAEMGRVGSAMAREAGQVIRTRDLERAIEIEAADDAMDDLHRHLFTMLLNPTWPHGIGPAIDITLIGRFYERYADHAVALARQIVYVVTGQMPDPITA